MQRFFILLILSFTVFVATSTAAFAANTAFVPNTVIVKYTDTMTPEQWANIQRETGTGQPHYIDNTTAVLKIQNGKSIGATIGQLQAQPNVRYAAPDALAHASAFIPNDPGLSGQPGGWQLLQWNFLAQFGINAPDAWQNLINAGVPGGKGVVVAVLDTGVAFCTSSRFPRSPDFRGPTFVRGFDFINNNSSPCDRNGHGTHVAGTIAEKVNNGIGLTGLAYGARIMPVRVLNNRGEGDAVAISKGIRWAAKHGAQVINMSLEFGIGIRAWQIPDVLSAIRFAHKKGAVIVSASGNEAARIVSYPARANNVIAVGATTEHRCLADYSNTGQGLDIVAPGGGADAPDDTNLACDPFGQAGRDIFQMTFVGSTRRFGFPTGFEGTSMAAPHVSATAALIIASRLLGPKPSPEAVENRLEVTAQDLGRPGFDPIYGAGLVDAAAATSP